MINNDKTQLQEHIDQLNESCESYSMKISTSKTEVTTVSKRPNKLDINFNGTQLKQTSEFKYLGRMFTEWKTRQRNRDQMPEIQRSQLPTCPITETPQHFHQY